ncbi:MAG: 4-hydroxythreonine-4-phosphate dehydrogenase PdxA [Gemmatimonadales bacterium]
MNARIAVTLGDPRGIGPEVARAVADDPPHGVDLVLLGPDDLVAGYESQGLGAFGEATGDAVAGEFAYRAIARAVDLVGAAEVDAICTAPASKKALNAAGHHFPGHTELLGHLAGGVDTAMMLASDDLRVVLVTTHVPFAAIRSELTEHRIGRVAALTRQSLTNLWGIAQPRIALCALNPHAGEGGTLGTEEAELLAPAALAAGIEGPFAADTVFVRAMRGEFDAVLAPYHDVGMTAIKVASFGRAVNVTLGLPFVRTSPDHGTAFDIAGKGLADPASMHAAVTLAAELSAVTAV